MAVMTKRWKLSPAALKLYLDCPRCFWLKYRAGIKRPTDGLFPKLPGSLDVLIKRRFDEHRERGSMPPELRELDGYTLFPQKEKLAVWRDYREGIVWEDEEGNVLMGAVDDLLVRDGRLAVLDYKTRGDGNGGVYNTYKLQLEVYHFLLEKNGYDVEDTAYILFFWPTASNHGHVVFETRLETVKLDTSRVEPLYREAISVLKRETPPPSSPSCVFCGWTKRVMRFFLEET